MPIRIEILTSGAAFPDTGDATQYLAALEPVRRQISDAIADFAESRVDRKLELRDVNGQPCGSIEILRF